ncbi:hypothetical protein lerEdw1_002367 [Lerista edwardsae]|nr:hypothetical protein lerEdw1_002370 [Lerista edwardsae]KAJ6650878.1 hypothetical protein lerEdw1_002367 [Lerista edwardsae]
MTLLYNIEYQNYVKDKDAMRLLRDLMIGNNSLMEKVPDEFIFSMIKNRTAGLREIKQNIHQVRSETRSMRELTSGIVGHGYPFYQTMFYIPKKTGTFEQATKECAKINATLVSVKTKEEQIALRLLSSKSTWNEPSLGPAERWFYLLFYLLGYV